MTPDEAKAVGTIEQLLTLQLVLRVKRLRDALFELMTNRLAAGYVFGFTDAALQISGLIDRNDPTAGFGVIKATYQSIFGDQAGFTLFNMSIHNQGESDFDVGRISGGEDFFEFRHHNVPPLGLSRIVCLGFDAAAVGRGLEGRKEDGKPREPTESKVPGAFSDEMIDESKNIFGKSYGTDHLLKMGWRSYLASMFPPEAKSVPTVDIESSWYAGVMLMFENIGEVCNSTDNARVAGSIIEGSVDRLWKEFHGEEDQEANLFKERKAAFVGGCWFISMVMMSMARDPDKKKFHENYMAIRNELADYAAKSKEK